MKDRISVLVIVAALAVVLGLIFQGCEAAHPQELELAAVLAVKAGEAIEADYQDAVAAATAEIEEKGLEILRREMESRIGGAADSRGTVSVDDVKSLIVFAQEQQAAIHEARDQKLADLRESPNLEILRKLNAKLGEYLKKNREGAEALKEMIDLVMPSRQRAKK